MPLPTPRSGESQDEFISRCMADETAREDFPDNDQRAGVCFTQWRNLTRRSKMQYLTVPFETKAVDDKGFISGYGSTFGNVDLGGDIIEKGAFSESLKVRMPKMLKQHSIFQTPGIWEKAEEDEKGLFLEGRFLDTQLGRDTRTEARAGVFEGLSIGFDPIDADFVERDERMIRILKTVDLFEVSPVVWPMNQEATIETVKSRFYNGGEFPEIKEFEKILRDLGFSRKQATMVASHGYRKLLDPSDSEPGVQGEPDLILKLTETIRGISQ